jgi:hypothetical protein
MGGQQSQDKGQQHPSMPQGDNNEGNINPAESDREYQKQQRLAALNRRIEQQKREETKANQQVIDFIKV